MFMCHISCRKENEIPRGMSCRITIVRTLDAEKSTSLTVAVVAEAQLFKYPHSNLCTKGKFFYLSLYRSFQIHESTLNSQIKVPWL